MRGHIRPRDVHGGLEGPQCSGCCVMLLTAVALTVCSVFHHFCMWLPTFRYRPAGSDSSVYSSPMATASGSDQALSVSADAAATFTTAGPPVGWSAPSANHRALAPFHLSYPAPARGGLSGQIHPAAAL